jgi:hypothetical protein
MRVSSDGAAVCPVKSVRADLSVITMTKSRTHALAAPVLCCRQPLVRDLHDFDEKRAA